MIILLSPAKTLDFEQPIPEVNATQPAFLKQSSELIDILKPMTPAEIAALMKVSDKIAALNVARFGEWKPSMPENEARPAIFAFQGDVYQGLMAHTLDEDALQRAQEQIRILSGLYGLLKPLDRIRPYRLEMGTRLANSRGKDLYAFWGDTLCEALNRELEADSAPVVVNLASNEYSKAARLKQLNAQVISPEFKDYKNGQYKVISFYAKKARGMMARWIVEKRISKPTQLKQFKVSGYAYAPDESSPEKPVFLRDGGEDA